MYLQLFLEAPCAPHAESGLYVIWRTEPVAFGSTTVISLRSLPLRLWNFDMMQTAYTKAPEQKSARPTAIRMTGNGELACVTSAAAASTTSVRGGEGAP